MVLPGPRAFAGRFSEAAQSFPACLGAMLQMLHFFYFALSPPEHCGCINYYRTTNCINHSIPTSAVADGECNIDSRLKFNTNACLTQRDAKLAEEIPKWVLATVQSILSIRRLSYLCELCVSLREDAFEFNSKSLPHAGKRKARREIPHRETSCVYITSGGEGFWGKNLSMLTTTNPQDFVQAWDRANENYLFFQMTPFFCLLNVKQIKIRGNFIFA